MALSYIRGKEAGALTSAREIAQYFDLPFEILAKTLQRLKEQGLIASTHGTRGGYVLSKDLKTMNLLEFLMFMEGPVGLVTCMGSDGHKNGAMDHPCAYKSGCNIRPVLSVLNGKIYDFLSRISLDELTRIPLTKTTAQQGAFPISINLSGEEP